MSQEVEIIEGARGRSFSRVNRIKTDKQDGGACFWVPENERRLTSLYAFQNGEYEPGNGYYAFDSVDASVMHFDDFDINIDDYDLPHIDLDGIDITIDETGIPHIGFDYEIVTVDDETIKVIYPDGKEVIIHGPDLDGVINIDDVFTIDYDKETGTWTITAIVNVTSGDNEFAPGDIVAQWPGTEHVDIHIRQSISIPDLGDIDLDFDADIDVSVDLDDMDVDISGIDMDGLDVDVNIDLDTLNIDTFELPDEIRIMHVPDKTSYKDGEEIDLDGLVVQAYRNGEVWEDKDGKYYNGYVPVHELLLPYKIATGTSKIVPIEGLCRLIGIPIPLSIEVSETLSVVFNYTGDGEHYPYNYYWNYDGEITVEDAAIAGIGATPIDGTSGYGYLVASSNSYSVIREDYTTDELDTYSGSNIHHESHFTSRTTPATYTFLEKTVYFSDIVTSFGRYGVLTALTPTILLNGETNRAKLAWIIVYGSKKRTVFTVKIQWPRPHDHKILSATFNISVEEGDAQPSGNAGGTDGTPNGHLGGTTTSGDHGGSHSSGNF